MVKVMDWWAHVLRNRHVRIRHTRSDSGTRAHLAVAGWGTCCDAARVRLLLAVVYPAFCVYAHVETCPCMLPLLLYHHHRPASTTRCIIRLPQYPASNIDWHTCHHGWLHRSWQHSTGLLPHKPRISSCYRTTGTVRCVWEMVSHTLTTFVLRISIAQLV
jgi:hypothetical protein